MSNQIFGMQPQWQHDSQADRYLGTWFGCDCYLWKDSSLTIRFGDKPHEYASHPPIGWNTWAAGSRLGGLGEGRTRAEYCIHSGDDVMRAEMAALAFLGRESLEVHESIPRTT